LVSTFYQGNLAGSAELEFGIKARSGPRATVWQLLICNSA